MSEPVDVEPSKVTLSRKRVTTIYAKYIALVFLLIGTFFTIQFTLIVKAEFKPYYALLPLLMASLVGSLLATVMLFREKLHLERDRLSWANREIGRLNQQLRSENVRMCAELDVTRRLQHMLIPPQEELSLITELDIAGFMEPAAEVGGDYLDVLVHDGRVKIGIGDVTGHGLESGMLMLMVQMAVRTLLLNDVTDPKIFMDVLNRSVFANMQRMNCDKNLTLALIDYQAGLLRLSGQHEEVLLVRKGGHVERVDTIDLGFMVGVTSDISEWVNYSELRLEAGDGMVLYTDGITEAMDRNKKQYGVERLCEVISRHWDLPAIEVQRAVVHDVLTHLNERQLEDDITLLVLKQR